MSDQASSAGIRPDSANQQVLQLERDLGSVATARTWLADFLSRAGVGAERCADAVLVVSELVTKALRHGVGDVVVRSSITGEGDVRVSVTDSGEGHPEVQPVEPSRVGGVGLRIVSQVADDWGVASFPGGTTVWAILANSHAA